MAAEGSADIPAGGIADDIELHPPEQQQTDAELPRANGEDSSARIIPQISDDVASGSSQQREELRATPCRDGPGAASASGVSSGSGTRVPDRLDVEDSAKDSDQRSSVSNLPGGLTTGQPRVRFDPELTRHLKVQAEGLRAV